MQVSLKQPRGPDLLVVTLITIVKRILWGIIVHAMSKGFSSLAISFSNLLLLMVLTQEVQRQVSDLVHF